MIYVPFYTLRIMRLNIKLIVLCALSSCKQTEYIPIHDTTYTVREVHDSTYIDRWHTRTINGDTVFIHDSIFESHVEWLHDTLRMKVEVPVEVPKTVVKEVEKELSWLQQTLIYIGIASLIYIIGKAVWKYIKTRRVV